MIVEGRSFYVTIRRDSRTGWLLGPYESHTEALDNVRIGREKANLADPYSFFDEFGTASLPSEMPITTVFGR